MRSHPFPLLRPLIAAIVGAVVFEVVNLALSAGQARSPAQVIGLVTVGALVGWMYELLRDISGQAQSIFTNFEGLSRRLGYEENALRMLLACPRHNDVLSDLIRESISKRFRSIPYISRAHFISYVTKAIQNSNCYQSVHRAVISSFNEDPTRDHINQLRRKRMAVKARIFLIEEAEVERMKLDLTDHRVLERYWESSGDVDSYWISFGDFKELFHSDPPNAFALFDRQLAIAYDAQHAVLTFDVMEEPTGKQERDLRLQVFELLDDQLRRKSTEPFARVPGKPKRMPRVQPREAAGEGVAEA